MKFLFLLLLPLQLLAQKIKIKNPQTNSFATEHEIKEYFNAYAEDLRLQRREAIASRYDTRGYYRVGNGSKTFVSFEELRNRYLTSWSGPKAFIWRDLSIDVLAPTAVVVTGLFDWQSPTGERNTFSYTGVLVKTGGKWRIRVEDESISPPTGILTTPISGNSSRTGMHKFSLTAKAGASITAHRHSEDMHITVVRGRKFILMGNLDTARVQRFDSASSFMIPANVWHLEWWEEETVEEIEIIAWSRTERATPCTPRLAIKKQMNYLPVKKEILSRYIGEYKHPTRAGGLYKVFFENDTLKLSRNWDNYKSPILPISETEFTSVDGLYTSLIFTNIVKEAATKLITTAQCVTHSAGRILSVDNKN